MEAHMSDTKTIVELLNHSGYICRKLRRTTLSTEEWDELRAAHKITLAMVRWQKEVCK